MTTKVKIELVQDHMPVAVDVLRSDGTVEYTLSLQRVGQAVEDYVHSGRSLRVRETTTAEMHTNGLTAR